VVVVRSERLVVKVAPAVQAAVVVGKQVEQVEQPQPHPFKAITAVLERLRELAQAAAAAAQVPLVQQVLGTAAQVVTV
jgi:hypothetical protein